ncbi:MAG: DUF2141 domain-containing protein [Pseudomonadota bacterium]
MTLSALFAALYLGLTGCETTSAPTPTALPVREGDLSVIVNVRNLRCCDGVLRLAVYHTPASWLREDQMLRGRIGFVLAEEQVIEVHGLPPGRYAIAVFQDLNGNKKLDRSFGIFPREPYAFSSDAGRYGPPGFEAAAISLTEDTAVVLDLVDRTR